MLAWTRSLWTFRLKTSAWDVGLCTLAQELSLQNFVSRISSRGNPMKIRLWDLWPDPWEPWGAAPLTSHLDWAFVHDSEQLKL